MPSQNGLAAVEKAVDGDAPAWRRARPTRWFFTAYATHKGKQRIKLIARYQQVEGVNRIVERVIARLRVKQGSSSWHFQVARASRRC